MDMQDFIFSLGIDKEIVYEQGLPTVFLKDSNEYAKIYSLLTESDVVKLVPESVIINLNITSLKFTCNEYDLILSADLTRNIYKISIEENI